MAVIDATSCEPKSENPIAKERTAEALRDEPDPPPQNDPNRRPRWRETVFRNALKSIKKDPQILCDPQARCTKCCSSDRDGEQQECTLAKIGLDRETIIMCTACVLKKRQSKTKIAECTFEAKELYGAAAQKIHRYLCPYWRDCEKAFMRVESLYRHLEDSHDLSNEDARILAQRADLKIVVWKKAMAGEEIVTVERQVAEWVMRDLRDTDERGSCQSDAEGDILHDECDSSPYSFRRPRRETSQVAGQLRSSGLEAHLQLREVFQNEVDSATNRRDRRSVLSESASSNEPTHTPQRPRRRIAAQGYSPVSHDSRRNDLGLELPLKYYQEKLARERRAANYAARRTCEAEFPFVEGFLSDGVGTEATEHGIHQIPQQKIVTLSFGRPAYISDTANGLDTPGHDEAQSIFLEPLPNDVFAGGANQCLHASQTDSIEVDSVPADTQIEADGDAGSLNDHAGASEVGVIAGVEDSVNVSVQGNATTRAVENTHKSLVEPTPSSVQQPLHAAPTQAPLVEEVVLHTREAQLVEARTEAGESPAAKADRACINCRGRHIPCDRTRPWCTQCSKKGLDNCQYLAPSQRIPRLTSHDGQAQDSSGPASRGILPESSSRANQSRRSTSLIEGATTQTSASISLSSAAEKREKDRKRLRELKDEGRELEEEKRNLAKREAWAEERRKTMMEANESIIAERKKQIEERRKQVEEAEAELDLFRLC